MSSHAVSLLGGPRSGTVEYIEDPWPRYGHVNVDDGHGGLAKYKLTNLGGGVWQGDYVPPGQTQPDSTGTEGQPGPTGPAGAPGPPGPQGSAGDDGSGFVFRGNWSAGTTYVEGDTVNYGGSCYVASTTVIGTVPDSFGAPWGIMASKGDPGATGPTGPAGATGPPGTSAPGVPGPPGPPGGDAIILDERINADPTLFYTRQQGSGSLVYNDNATVPGQAYFTMNAVGNDGFFYRNDTTLDINIRNVMHAIEVQSNAGSGTPIFALRIREQSDRWVQVQAHGGNLIIFTTEPSAPDINRASVAITLAGVQRAWLVAAVFHDAVLAFWTLTHPMALAMAGLQPSGGAAVQYSLAGMVNFSPDAYRVGRSRMFRISPGGSDLANHRIYRHMVIDLDKLPAFGGGGGTGGSGGGSGADLNYVHNQSVAASIWNVSHNLGKYPAVDVVNSGGNVIWPDVSYIDANNVRVTLGVPDTGKAYVN